MAFTTKAKARRQPKESSQAKTVAGIPEQFWRCMAPGERLRVMDAEAAKADAAAHNEEDLHLAFSSQLEWRGIYVIHSRMDLPTTYAVGVPDFVFAAPDRNGLGRPASVEFKWGKNTLSKEQEAAITQMRSNGWLVSVAWSVREALDFLAQIENSPQLS